MKIYVHYNESMQIIGFYNDDVHEEIPQPNIEITHEVWQERGATSNYVDIEKRDIYKKNNLEQKKEEYKNLVMQICDQKQNNVLVMLLGHKATPSQLERYKRKYQRAKLGEFTADENQAIINAHESFLKKTDIYVDMIEASRTFLSNKIDQDKFKEVDILIEKLSELDEKTTMDQLQKLLVATN